MKDIASLLDALATIAWPFLVGVVLFKLWPLVQDIAKSRGFTIKYGDAELSVQDASDQLRKQIEDLQNQVSWLLASPEVDELREQNLIQPTTDNRKRTLLWVDDKPSNNAYEVAKFKDDGFLVTQVKSTSDALEWIANQGKPSVVISDMGRNESGQYVSDAGLQLIRAIRNQGVQSPVFIYTSKRYAQLHHDQTLEAGGNGATASPVALFSMVSTAGI